MYYTFPSSSTPTKPQVRLGGASTPGGVALEVYRPPSAGGTKLMHIEFYPTDIPLGSTNQGIQMMDGSYRETLGRPDSGMMERRRLRSQSIGFGGDEGGGRRTPLLNRIAPDQRYIEDPARFRNISTPDNHHGFHHHHQQQQYGGGFRPPSTNPSIHTQDNGGGFARPFSRMSNQSSYSNRGGGGGFGGMRGGYRGGFQGGMRGGGHHQYRPYSRNSMGGGSSYSNGRMSTSAFGKQRDSYYPSYNDDNVCVGSHGTLPADRIRPWFTPVPEKPLAGVLIQNLCSDTTPSDIKYTFQEFGEIKDLRIVDTDLENTSMTVIIAYGKKDDADLAITKFHDVTADGKVLKVTHIDLTSLPPSMQGKSTLDSLNEEDEQMQHSSQEVGNDSPMHISTPRHDPSSSSSATPRYTSQQQPEGYPNGDSSTPLRLPSPSPALIRMSVSQSPRYQPNNNPPPLQSYRTNEISPPPSPKRMEDPNFDINKLNGASGSGVGARSPSLPPPLSSSNNNNNNISNDTSGSGEGEVDAEGEPEPEQEVIDYEDGYGEEEEEIQLTIKTDPSAPKMTKTPEKANHQEEGWGTTTSSSSAVNNGSSVGWEVGVATPDERRGGKDDGWGDEWK